MSMQVRGIIKNDPMGQIKQDPGGDKKMKIEGGEGLPYDHIDQEDAWTVIKNFFD